MVKENLNIGIDNILKAPRGKKILGFLDGSYWVVNESDCRGCLMVSKKKDLADYLKPIYSDDDLQVIQDAEFAVPGFYVISTTKHYGTIADIPIELSMKMGALTHLVRKGMKDILKIKHAEIYHEERMENSHFHQWIIPCWEDNMNNSGYIPTIFKSKVTGYRHLTPDVLNYLRSFSFKDERGKILKFNKQMSKYLKTQMDNIPIINYDN